MSSRPQVGIERLPARRLSNEPRESMNCKSCRKRKIKCNRLRPTCEACQVFQCPCIYDAIPKKRGPKTDVLEALLKRVDGLEKRLKEEKKANSGIDCEPKTQPQLTATVDDEAKAEQVHAENNVNGESAIYSPTPPSDSTPTIHPDVLVDTFFSRCHGKPYFILDETSTRQQTQLQQMPSHTVNAMFAVSSRFAAHPNGYHAAVKLSEDHADRARNEVDLDDPSIENMQTLLLLSIAYMASGKGKKAYMMLASGIGMAMALEAHREIDLKSRVTPIERETRRRLFWTCYVMDRFASCGSKRPSLISDKSILLRLPSWSPNPASLPIEGEFFQNGSNLQYHAGSGKKSQGSSGMLIDIVRILGITNRYLAAGGVKGDSHFPWHALSNLSKIRQDLDVWASGTQDVFTSVDALFGQPDSTTLVLSKLIYHLIHCLIYRPFLPIDLAELAGSGQHQSWQIEATNLCFLHANAVAELVELGKQSASIEWPAFVGYCICTAGTVHVHGAHYKGGREEVFSASADFLSREMQQLTDLRYAWSSVQHQRETLQSIYGCHSELVKSLATNPMRFSPVFHLEDFFDRYNTLGQTFDGAHISFVNVNVDPAQDFKGHDLYRNGSTSSEVPRRKDSANRKPELKATQPIGSLPMTNGMQKPLPSPTSQASMASHEQPQILPENNNQPQFGSPAMSSLANLPFSPPYNFANLPGHSEGIDPMFSMSHIAQVNTNFPPFEAQPQSVMTPGGRSNNGSTGTGGEEKDPFLSLLEQLAENEHSRGGPSELDFFLSGQGQ